MIANPAGRGARALLLSAYDAASHRHWRHTLTGMFPGITWQQLTLPPRHFRWRIRGNSLYWALEQRERLTADHDFLLATSMTDLSALRGLVPKLTRLPTAVYFHENQFAYPFSEAQKPGIEIQLLNLYTALCADQLVFNSAYNQRTFVEGVENLMRRMPDTVPTRLSSRLPPARVIPVPLSESLFQCRQESADHVLTIAWNHRWEYDKGPALLLALIRELVRRELPFRIHLMGQQFRHWPAEFDTAASLLTEHCDLLGIEPGTIGHVESARRYRALLAESDVVLSTARHDFQGLSMLEGMALGCTPLAPRRLVYPEYLPPVCLYGGDGDCQNEATAAAERIADWTRLRAHGEALPRVDADAFRTDRLAPRYRELFGELSAAATDR